MRCADLQAWYGLGRADRPRNPNTVGAFAWYDPPQSNPPDQTVQVGIPISVNLAAFASGGIPPYHWFASLT